jgi:excisionase family DNA binding protein
MSTVEQTSVDTSDGDELLRVDETADALRACKATVYRRIADGSLPAYRLGGVLRIPASGVTAFLLARRVNPPTDGDEK